MAAVRSWFERGTLRNPGPHLHRMPIAFDFARISLAEGLRAALASGVILLLSVWFASFPLLIMAFAANLTCFCDSGGPVQTRVRALLAYTFAGASCWIVFGLLRNLPWPLIVPLAGAVVFLCSMARVWGTAAQAVGNVLIVTLALALDAPLSLKESAVIGPSFVVGGLWAVVLTMVIWRIHPTRPATRAIEDVWSSLAALGADLRRLIAGPADEGAWEAHARAHRRATRAAIEEARALLAGMARATGPVSPSVCRTIVRLEGAETAFGGLIALSDVLEAGAPRTRTQGLKALRLLQPLLVLCGHGRFEDRSRFTPVLLRIDSLGGSDPALAPLIEAVTDGLRIALRADAPDDRPLLSVRAGEDRSSLAAEAVGRFRDNLTWRSAILRHGVRATVLTVPAMAWSLIWWSPYSHWLTITVALTMQPYFAATWQRVLERIGGTLLGGLIGAAIAFVPQTSLVKAVLLVPLCVLGFSVRQVSYGAYIACLTPLVVVLFDVAVPGHSDAMIATMRLVYTVAGGALALCACLLLWPSWEPDRLPGEISAALAAHARFADLVLAGCLGNGDREATEAARRAAGVANNNLEASLSRLLQEPRHGRNRPIEAGLVVDAAVRRLGAVLVTLQHETAAYGVADPVLMTRWRHWIGAALEALSRGQAVADAAPPAAAESTLARVRRTIGIMESALAAPRARDRARRDKIRQSPCRRPGAPL